MKIIFISGPYRGTSEFAVVENIRNAEKAAIFVWQHGAAALCPHKNTALFGGLCPDEIWLKGDNEMLLRCDAVFAIPGWKHSYGSIAEINLATEKDIPVLYSDEDVVMFINRGIHP